MGQQLGGKDAAAHGVLTRVAVLWTYITHSWIDTFKDLIAKFKFKAHLSTRAHARIGLRTQMNAGERPRAAGNEESVSGAHARTYTLMHRCTNAGPPSFRNS